MGENSKIKNSSLSSAFELKASGSQNILNGGKSLTDVALSAGISGGTYGLFRGIGALGNYGVNYANSRGASLLSSGFSPGSSAYQDLARIWAGSQVLNFTGGYAGFGAGVTGNLFGN